MEAVIDQAGRIVVPKPIRDARARGTYDAVGVEVIVVT
jgi:bifunctional DNA-binding transcriptional regulator/antitoxin component of YhaV-PrlF toxin-antitoxin module